MYTEIGEIKSQQAAEDLLKLLSAGSHDMLGSVGEILRDHRIERGGEESKPSLSTRQETTKMLSEYLEHFLNPHNDPRIYTAREVTFDYASAHRIRVDYMRFLPKNNSADGIEQGVFYCYEIKSSGEDFHSPNGHNFLGDYNYYVMPEEVYKQVKEEIQERYNGYVGVYVPEWNGLSCIKKARKKERERSTAEMLLMMFRSSNRELLKSSCGLPVQEKMLANN